MSQTEQKPTAAVDDGKVADVKSDKHESYEAPAGYSLADHLKTIGVQFNGSEYTQGYSATLTADQLTKVRSDCNVKLVEDDFPGHGFSDATIERRAEQKSAPWPLYYSSSTEKNPSDHSFYSLGDAGKGVDIYVMDSGINHLDEFKTD
ncbi:hypothetical protein AMS68_006665 [Peltaster fructicola]|uniref:Peptidase S8/S53 domain-containing protein n=1 Tax=Peltaster fructicola TaxID=286661 RepID=A0A6H0Y2S0_9PEZI|nr:hypothetical protein AMS68_006665 [Peltaster fructicola]